jgi:hypothetical protein
MSNYDNDKPDRTINEILYEFMSGSDKLTELSKLVGQLRFAAEEWEGFYDKSMIEEVESEILSLSMYLSDNYMIQELIQSAKLWSESGSVLTQLYLERCYRLYEENYTELQKTEDKIKWIESHLNQFR